MDKRVTLGNAIIGPAEFDQFLAGKKAANTDCLPDFQEVFLYAHLVHAAQARSFDYPFPGFAIFIRTTICDV